MNENKTEKSYHLIAGILFAAAFAVQYLLRPVIYGYTQGFNFWIIVFILGLLGTAVLMFLKRRDLFTVIAIALIAIFTIYCYISYFDMGTYGRFGVSGAGESGYNRGYYMETSSFLMFIELLYPVAALLLVLFAAVNFTGFLGNTKDKLNGLWFLPAAVMGVYTLLSVLKRIIVMLTGFYCPPVDFMYFMFYALQAAAFLFAGLWMAKPNGLPKSETVHETEEGNTAAYTEVLPEAYCGLVKHILLLLFTCGIWLLIWVYRMTGYTNSVKGEEKRNPTNKLLLYIFVPFYSIYWMYKTAQRIDNMAKAKNVESDLATLCLILAIFVPIVAPILMQDKMNKIVKTKGVRASASESAEGTTIGVADELKKYKELLDAGIISEEEFETKKKQLLGM